MNDSGDRGAENNAKAWTAKEAKNTQREAKKNRSRSLTTFNEVFSKLSLRRRYEVWFLRLGLADGSGAWWFRYLLTNPGRDGSASDARQQPIQIWATWFPRQGKPRTWIQGF